jgi:sialic acid synthase SpsE
MSVKLKICYGGVMNYIQINDRKIGSEFKPYVIVEVGINHEGSIEKAIQLVDAAVESGAEVVKFQCHITDKEMIPTDMKPGKISDEKLWDIIKRCELTEKEEREVQRYCKSKGVEYLSTPFSKEAANRLFDMGVPAFKIGSGECNNYPLIEHIAKMNKPVILSTGMNNIDSISKAVLIFKKHNTPYALLHCTSMYPTPYEKVRLGAIPELLNTFGSIPVGLSDHSLNIWTCLGAVSLGASILEKHFTISRSWPGPDTGISIEPHELKDLILGSEAIWKARGGTKNILEGEIPVIDFAYASVVSTKVIRKGEKLSEANIWVKRPGKGDYRAEQYEGLIGKVSLRDIPADTYISKNDIG